MPASAGQDILNALIEAFTKATDKDKSVMPTWDTTGALKRPFVEQVGERLPDADPDFHSLLHDGSVRVGSKIAVSNIAHALALDRGDIPTYSVFDPAPLVYVAPPPMLVDDEDELVLDAADEAWPPHFKDTYIVSPVAIGRVDREMAKKALSGISIETTRKSMLAAAGGSGNRLMRQFGQYLVAADSDPRYDATIESVLKAFLKRPLDSPTLPAWNLKKGVATMMNESLSCASRKPEAQIAAMYILCVRATTATLKNTLPALMRGTGKPRPGRVLEDTILRIEEALNEEEADDLQTALESLESSGRALIGSSPDPAKNKRKPRPRSGDGSGSSDGKPAKPAKPCYRCKAAGLAPSAADDLLHWNNNCPRYASQAAAEEAGKASLEAASGKGHVARSDMPPLCQLTDEQADAAQAMPRCFPPPTLDDDELALAMSLDDEAAIAELLTGQGLGGDVVLSTPLSTRSAIGHMYMARDADTDSAPMGTPVSAAEYPLVIGFEFLHVDSDGAPVYRSTKSGDIIRRPELRLREPEPIGTPGAAAAAAAASAAAARSTAPPCTPGTPFSSSGLSVDSPLPSLKQYTAEHESSEVREVATFTGGPTRRTKAHIVADITAAEAAVMNQSATRVAIATTPPPPAAQRPATDLNAAGSYAKYVAAVAATNAGQLDELHRIASQFVGGIVAFVAYAQQAEPVPYLGTISAETLVSLVVRDDTGFAGDSKGALPRCSVHADVAGPLKLPSLPTPAPKQPSVAATIEETCTGSEYERGRLEAKREAAEVAREAEYVALRQQAIASTRSANHWRAALMVTLFAITIGLSLYGLPAASPSTLLHIDAGAWLASLQHSTAYVAPWLAALSAILILLLATALTAAFAALSIAILWRAQAKHVGGCLSPPRRSPAQPVSFTDPVLRALGAAALSPIGLLGLPVLAAALAAAAVFGLGARLLRLPDSSRERICFLPMHCDALVPQIRARFAQAKGSAVARRAAHAARLGWWTYVYGNPQRPSWRIRRVKIRQIVAATLRLATWIGSTAFELASELLASLQAKPLEPVPGYGGALQWEVPRPAGPGRKQRPPLLIDLPLVEAPAPLPPLTTAAAPPSASSLRSTAAPAPPSLMQERGSQYGRALLGGKHRGTLKRDETKRSRLLPAFAQTLSLILDSGATWHVHHRRSDLINLRSCSDRITGIDGKPLLCTGIGDLPIVATDAEGKPHRLLIEGVRLIPSMTDTLLSVDQLWEGARSEARFANFRSIFLPPSESGGQTIFPFGRRHGLYTWSVVGNAAEPNRPAAGRALRSSIHGPHARSHIANLSPDDAARFIHRRLHAGVERIRRLPSVTADAPEVLARARSTPCADCIEANATRHSHTQQQYQRSHPGAVVHADIVGPFKSSVGGAFKYLLVLVDDHSRYKAVFPMRAKSDAPRRIREYVAAFNRLAARGGMPIQRVGALHTDNAGEFISGEFTEWLDDNGIAATTCPPHVHALNGVAERAIRSIMECARSCLVASNLPPSFWPYVAEHACDIINRTTGPPDADMTSWEALTGSKPRIMSILPIGCRAWAVKPRGLISKTNLDTRAFTPGENLGRSSSTPGAYYVWIPEQKKVVCTSDVYFDETLFPRQPLERQRVDEPPPHRAPADDDAACALPPADAAPQAAERPAPPSPPPPTTMAEAYADATARRAADTRHSARRTIARRSRRVLLLFSGPYRRPDGLANYLRRLGLDVTLVDNSEHGGDESHDLTGDTFYSQLLQRAHRGDFLAVLAAPPCSTFSIARFIDSPDAQDGGPRPLRTRAEPDGLSNLPDEQARELRAANLLVDRTVAILEAAHNSGSEFILENPADYGNSSDFHFLHASHAPLWHYRGVKELGNSCDAEQVTFAMCAVGAPYRKLTTLLYSRGLSAALRPFADLVCTHSSHAGAAGGSKRTDGSWSSAETAAYPTELNLLLAQALCSLTTVPAALDAPPREARQQPMTKQQPPVDEPEPEFTLHEALGNPPAETMGDRHLARVERADAEAKRLPFQSDEERDELSPPHDEQDLFAEPASSPRGGASAESPAGEPSPALPTLSPSPSPSPAAPKPRRTVAEKWISQGVLRGAGGGIGAYPLRSRGARVLLGRSVTHQVPPSFWRSHGCALEAKPSPSTMADPTSRREALAQDTEGWQAAELLEIENHNSNESFTVMDHSDFIAEASGRRTVKLTWVYKRKRSGKLKARLCVQGCSQIPGVDYDQTWCGTMRGATLRVLAALSTQLNLHMHRWDFTAAYLQGSLEEGETVYCTPPPGYETVGADGRQRIYRVDRPIYGMAQAGRRWQRTLFPWLSAWSARIDGPPLAQGKYESCVFSLVDTVQTPDGPREERLIIGVYVDDLCTCASHTDEYSLYAKFTADLKQRWAVEDEGPCSDLLGIEITQTNEHTTLTQRGYIERLVSRFCPDGVPTRGASTPADVSLPQLVADALSAHDEPTAAAVRDYQCIIGALLYVSVNTRPDIAYAVSYLGRAMSRPSPALQEAALHVIHYLHRHRDLGLRFVRDGGRLYGMSDSDWAVKHSTSGHVFMYCQAAISWASRKQKSVALSSCEAEIVAASDAGKEAVYLQNLLCELGLGAMGPIPVSVDNTAARNLAYNPEHHERTKHIDRRHFYIRELVEEGRITVPFVCSADNLADFFTKPLAPAPFTALRNRIMGYAH